MQPESKWVHTCKPIHTVVGELYGFFFSLERLDCQYRTEYLLTNNPATLLWVEEDGRLDELSLGTLPDTSGQQCRTLLSNLHVRHDAVKLALVYYRAKFGRWVQWIRPERFAR